MKSTTSFMDFGMNSINYSAIHGLLEEFSKILEFDPQLGSEDHGWVSQLSLITDRDFIHYMNLLMQEVVKKKSSNGSIQEWFILFYIVNV